MGIAFMLVSGFTYGQTIVGADSDKHGCKGSAGYTYSVLKKECIQVFNQETQLTQTTGGTTWLAAVVFDAGKQKAEIFMKDLSGSSLVLARKGKPEIWKKGTYELAKTASGYSLKKDGTEIYKSN